MFPEENISTDVSSATDSSTGVDTSTAALSVSEEQPAQTTASSDVTAQPSVGEEAQAEDDADGRSHFIPNEELEANPDRIAKALLRVQQSHERLWEKHRPLESLSNWQDVVSKFNDPSEVVAQKELIEKIHSPAPDGQSGFTTLPFLNDLEAQSPGTVHKLAMDSLGLQVEMNGQTDSLVRHLFRGWGLDPDRVEDYKEIDARAPAGVITQDQLAGIDQKYHAAFKALSQAQREDILLQRNETTGEFPAAVMDYLQDKSEALEARQWREQDNQRKTQEAQERQQTFERETVQAVHQDISTVRREMYDAIHQHLASQWKPSSDEFQSKVEYRKVMGTLASLLEPELRWTAEEALKDAGVQFDPKAFDELVNSFVGARESYTRFTRQGDRMQASHALSAASLAKAVLNTKLNEYALALAKPSADRLETQSKNLVSSLQGATARVVPSGNVQPTSGNGNPYLDNPHQFGSQEYLAYNKRLDKELGVGGAAALAR
jgi:hypothetical protein